MFFNRELFWLQVLSNLVRVTFDSNSEKFLRSLEYLFVRVPSGPPKDNDDDAGLQQRSCFMRGKQHYCDDLCRDAFQGFVMAFRRRLERRFASSILVDCKSSKWSKDLKSTIQLAGYSCYSEHSTAQFRVRQARDVAMVPVGRAKTAQEERDGVLQENREAAQREQLTKALNMLDRFRNKI